MLAVMLVVAMPARDARALGLDEIGDLISNAVQAVIDVIDKLSPYTEPIDSIDEDLWVTDMFTSAPGALGCANCLCVVAAHAITRLSIRSAHDGLRNYVQLQMRIHKRSFVDNVFLGRHVFARPFPGEYEITGMGEVAAVGKYLDAQNQIETQRLLDEKKARAAQDYQPDQGMCVFGTAVRGLGANSRNGETLALVMGDRSRQRQLMSVGSGAESGRDADMASRKQQFKRRYCDPAESAGGMRGVCETGGHDGPRFYDRDIDFGETVYDPLSLEMDLMYVGAAFDGQQDVMALSRNLFAHEIYQSPLTIPDDDHMGIILDMRAIAAKRSVAQYSFDSIVGMKAMGTAESPAAPFAAAALSQLGMSSSTAADTLGEAPSYYALMELLTKRLYQDEQFYTNLYDTPANLDRKGAALRAVGLMQDMDLFKSKLRNEAMASVLLELELEGEQESVQADFNTMRAR